MEFDKSVLEERIKNGKKRPSELFDDMEQVRGYAEYLKTILPLECHDDIMVLLGLSGNTGTSNNVTINGIEVQIDVFLAPMIEDLINRGYSTLACCSGLAAEHTAGREQRTASRLCGYLSLSYDKELISRLREKIKDNEVSITEGECYLQRDIHISILATCDEQMKIRWQTVWNALKTIKEEPG